MLDLFTELSPLFQPGIFQDHTHRGYPFYSDCGNQWFTSLANDTEDCLLWFLVVYSLCSYL